MEQNFFERVSRRAVARTPVGSALVNNFNKSGGSEWVRKSAMMARDYERSVQLGNAGEHLVMAHLLASGFQAFMADRGNPGFDISVVDGNKHSLLRVKCTNSSNVVWGRKKSGTTFVDLRQKGDFCCIVDLRDGVAAAKIYIVPTMEVQRAIDEGRQNWLSKSRRDGKPRKDSTDQRLWLDDKIDGPAYRGFRTKWSKYFENWEQLRENPGQRGA